MADPVTPPSNTPPAVDPASPGVVVPPSAGATPPPGESFVKIVDPAATAAPPVAAPVARPEGLPDDYWDADKGVKFDAVNEALTEAAAARAAKAALPKTAEEYLPTLPAELKLPEGTKIDVNDPRFKAAQKLALDSGMSQAKFTELLGIEAAGAVAKNAQIQAAITARNEALGANGVARVDAVTNFFNAIAPTPKVAAELAQTLWTPGIIEAWEGIQRALGDQGVAGLTRARAADTPPPGTIPGYEGMSFAEKMAASMNMAAAKK